MSWAAQGCARAALAVALAAPLHSHAAPTADDDTTALKREVEAMRTELAARKAEVQALEAKVERMRRVTEAPPPAGVAGPEITVGEGQSTEEAIAIWHDVHVVGHVTGDALAIGGDVVVHAGGQVDGDAVSIGGSVRVDEGGHVAGDKVALGFGPAPSPTPASSASPQASGHHAAGSLVLATGANETVQWLYHRLVWMLTIAGAGVITVGLFPDRVARVASDVSRRPVRSALVGTIATSTLVLFALLFLALTFGLGSPVSLAILAALAVAWLLGFVGFCQALGDRLPVDSEVHGRWLALGAGVTALAFAGSLPWVGWLGLLGVSMVGIGAALSTRFGSHPT